MWRGRKDKRESLLFGRSISFQSEKVRWKEVGSRSSISFFGEEMNRFRFATQRTPFLSHIKDRSWWFVSGNWSRFFLASRPGSSRAPIYVKDAASNTQQSTPNTSKETISRIYKKFSMKYGQKTQNSNGNCTIQSRQLTRQNISTRRNRKKKKTHFFLNMTKRW